MSLFIPSNGSRGLKILQEQPHFKGNSPGLARSVSPWASAAGSGAGQPIRAHLIRINRSFLKRKGKANKPFDRGESLVYCEGGNSTGIILFFWSAMGSFGKDLRKARLSRGVALEDITAETKISPRYLQALEQEDFAQLPGGILSKGIVRGYAAAVGLDQNEWTQRFLNASEDSSAADGDDNGWTEFASNVGKARTQRGGVMDARLRWIGAILLLLVGIACAFLAVRYYGLRAGWWPGLLPAHGASAHAMYVRVLSRIKL
jgi:transcriptional regulator with XRE-family HTH domain